MEIPLPASVAAAVHLRVEAHHTAAAVGSGALEVLATPVMIAWMEQAAFTAVQPHLPAGFTTVGSRVEIEHLRPTPPGETVHVTASLQQREGRILTFSVQAADSRGEIGRGRHQRVIVDTARFMGRIAAAPQ